MGFNSQEGDTKGTWSSDLVEFGVLVPVVQRMDNAIHWINDYPVDSMISFVNTFLLDSDLSHR